MITVRTVGAAEIRIGRKRITPATERMFALAVYLCVRAGDRLTREDLSNIFWPNAESGRARHSLRQMLYRLRSEGLALLESADEIRVSPESVSCDFTDLVNDLRPLPTSPTRTDVGVDFLAGFHPRISAAFESWLEDTRSRLAAIHRRDALEQVRRARREGRWSDLDRWGKILLSVDPLNEEGVFARAESAVLSGSKSVALSILDEYVSDLGERSTQIGLPAHLLRRRISETQHEWGARASRESPLLGREKEMSVLTRAVMLAKGGSGSAYLLIGPAGVGKSRLAEEVSRFASLYGFASLRVHASPADRGRPLSLAVRLAEGLLETSGVAGCAPSAYSLLKRVSSPGGAFAPLDSIAGAPIPQQALAWSFAEGLAAAAQERPIVIVVDDLHHADESSLAVMSALASRSAGARCLIITTKRLDASVATHVAVDPCAAFAPIRVAPLSHAAARSLVDTLVDSSPGPLSSADQDSLLLAAGGNPLFIRELAAQRSALRGADRLPDSLQQLIDDRIARFSANDLRVLRLITIMGPLSTLARLRQLATPAAHLSEIIERLELEGLLEAPEPGRLTLHECWQQGIAGHTGAAVFSSLAVEVAEVLQTTRESDDELDARWRAAELLESAGERVSARRAFASAGDHLLSRGVAHSAVVAYERALANTADPAERLTLSTFLASAQHANSMHRDAIATCHSALAQCAEGHRGSASARALLLALRAESELRCKLDHRDTLEALVMAVEDPNADDDVRQQACLYALRLVFADINSTLATNCLSASRAAARRSGLSPFGALVELVFAAEAGSAGDATEAEKVLAVMRTDQLSLAVRTMILRYRATCVRWLGRTAEASSLSEQALQLSDAAGLGRESALAACALTFMSLDNDNPRAAESWLVVAEERAKTSLSHDLERGLLHARGRLLLQTHRYSECCAHYMPQLELIRSDSVSRRRAVDIACIALAAANTGQDAFALELVSDAERALDLDTPAVQLDFVADSLSQALSKLGDARRANDVGKKYMRRRQATCDRPLSASCIALRALSSAEQSA